MNLLIRARSRWLAGGLLFPLAACIAYKPTLYLDESPATIPAEVFVEPLSDASPPEDKEDPAGPTLSQTSAGEMEGDLAPLVTKAIVADFSATGVFRSVGSSRNGADLILTGMIRRFRGQVSLPPWLVIPGVSMAAQAFWGLTQEWEGEVELEFNLSSPDGRLLGTYRGHSSYYEIAQHDRRFWSMPLYPAHVRLNQAFTDAVRQVREQILKDRDRLIARQPPPASSGGLR